MCGTAPVTPPAQACSPRLDGEPTFCPTTLPDIKPKPTLPKQEVKGEVDIYNPYHWHTLHGVFVENLIRKRIEEMFPEQNKIELFAREAPEGWDVHGNEGDDGINILSLEVE